MSEKPKELESAVDNVSLNDKRVEIQTFDRYKGRKDVTDRLAVLSTSLLRVLSHSVEVGKKRTTFKCISTKERPAECCNHLGMPDQKFGLILFQYTTDEQGSLVSDDKLIGRIKLWVISETRYTELSNTHKEFPLLNEGFDKPQHDLLIKCTEEQYQRMTFTPCKEAFWKKKKEWYDALMPREAKAVEKLRRAMGHEFTELEILETLAVDVGSTLPGTPKVGEITIDDDILG